MPPEAGPELSQTASASHERERLFGVCHARYARRVHALLPASWDWSGAAAAALPAADGGSTGSEEVVRERGELQAALHALIAAVAAAGLLRVLGHDAARDYALDATLRVRPHRRLSRSPARAGAVRARIRAFGSGEAAMGAMRSFA